MDNMTTKTTKITIDYVMDQEANNRLLEVIKPLVCAELNLTSQQLYAFLLICSNQGLSASELMEITDYPKATASRIMRTLSPNDGPHREGYGLIELIHDKADYRIRRAYLTDRGRVLALGLQSTMKK